ncbi:P-loop NTPase fold protein, partial [Chishuiella changwenlii]
MPKNDALNYLKENNIWIKGICTILIIVYIIFPFLDNQLRNSFLITKKLSEYNSFRFIYWIIFSTILSYNVYCLFIRKYVYSKFYLFTTTVLSISYIFIRFDDSLRTNIKFSEYDRYLNLPFYYLDILLFILLFNIFHLIIRSCEEIFPKNEIIYFTDSNDDDEILNNDDNDFELQNYIDNINDLILKQTPKRTFTISLNSKWGTGKTFFLEKLEKKLKESNEIIIIPFNAWKYEDSSSLLKEYFNTIGKELSKYNANASKAFHNYFISIFNYGGVNIKSFAEGISDYLLGNRDNSLNKTKKIVKDLDKKIVIIIDDIDRLKKKELFEVLKLIRNLSDYPNFYIITTIDNNYLINEGKLDGSYLEKIFNLQIDLPLINNYTLNEYYNKCLLTLLEEQTANLIIESTNTLFNESTFFKVWNTFNNRQDTPKADSTSEGNLVNVQLQLIIFLYNRRQVKRFVNNLKFAHLTKINKYDLLLDKYLLVNLVVFKYPIMKHLMSIENIRYYTTNNNQGKLSFDKKIFLDFLEKHHVDFNVYDKSIL